MKKSQKTQATLAASPNAASLTAPAKVQPGPTPAVDGQLLTLAARGGERDLQAAFELFADMSLEELRLTRRAAWRLEEWTDDYFASGNTQGK